MGGSELVELYPEEFLEGAEKKRIKELKKCDNEDEFVDSLKNFAWRSYPIWIYGLPRTGSSWLISHFLGDIFSPVYNEPGHFVQCSSVKSNREKINLNSGFENPRPELSKRLALYQIPEDRLMLAIHKRFAFKFLFDFNIVPEILNIYPRSRFIWITRDGRDQIHSFYKPDPDHWPQSDFKFLGDNEKERFAGAVVRFVNFTQRQLEILRENKNRIIRVQYERFTENFQHQARALLNFAGISVSEEELEKQEENFEARHGMWNEWEEWQKQMFIDSGAEDLNKMIGYGNKKPETDKVWKRSFR